MDYYCWPTLLNCFLNRSLYSFFFSIFFRIKPSASTHQYGLTVRSNTRWVQCSSQNLRWISSLKTLRRPFGLCTAWKYQKLPLLQHCLIIWAWKALGPWSRFSCSSKVSMNSLMILSKVCRCSPCSMSSIGRPDNQYGGVCSSIGNEHAHSRSIRDVICQSSSTKMLLGWRSVSVSTNGPSRYRRDTNWWRRPRIIVKAANCSWPSFVLWIAFGW